jgi:plasmid stability protein
MASITIRNLKEDTKKRLRLRAAEHGRSLEAEARDLLDRGVLEGQDPGPKNGLDLFRGLRAAVEKYGGVELELPERGPIRGLPPLKPVKRSAARNRK